MTYIQLSYWDIAMAATLLTVNAGLSIYYRLGTEKRLLIAAARMTVQLTMVALVLKALFATVSPWLTLLAALVMVAFAGREAMARQERTFIGFWGYGLGTVSMLIAAGIVLLFTLSTQLHADPWYDPRYAIPILGMILGNTMTGVSLSLDRLLAEADSGRARIEARLALGHSFREAMQQPLKSAMRAGLIPTVNGMAAAGLVSLPGMMTGQILAGVDPVEAVKYQLLIMFLLAGGTALGVFCATMIALKRLTDPRQRLRLDRLRVE
ncbi:iron export ABC transporter permease subunit FetB [Thalassospiraceae bacterium LMO-JJ14]|nr:iron export ABC transporter permease subunit FetB [Thalassospiraceae bacterium LMO-JJ14]